MRKSRSSRISRVLCRVEGLEPRLLLSVSAGREWAGLEESFPAWAAAYARARGSSQAGASLHNEVRGDPGLPPDASTPPGRIPQAWVDRLMPTLTSTASALQFCRLYEDSAAWDSAAWDSAAWSDGDGTISPLTAQSAPLIRLDTFRAAPQFAGIDGRGFAVVIIDTGIDLNHPAFGPDANGDGISDRIVYSYDFSGSNDADASDTNGHGSNVSSIVASSNSSYRGMAPGANIIHLKVFPDGATPSASNADIEEALRWVVNNAATYNIVSVNLSLGAENLAYSQNATSWSDEFAAMVALGIIPVAATGNDFYTYSSAVGVGNLASEINTIAVGAVWDSNSGSQSWTSGAADYTTAANRITSFTQRHEVLLDVLAPGAFITGANQSGGSVSYAGTSQATPHIAGIAALVQQLAVQTLGRRLTLDEFRHLLQTTGVTVNDGDDENDNVVNTGFNFARVDMLALGNAILAMAPGTIQGKTYHDQNGDGNSSGDSGLAGWTVYLDGNNNAARDNGSTTISSTDVSKAIPDMGTIRSNLDVSGVPGVITDINVRLNISHNRDSHIDAYLISPSGTRVELFTDVGGLNTIPFN